MGFDGATACLTKRKEQYELDILTDIVTTAWFHSVETEVWPQPEHKALPWLISWAAPVTTFFPTSKGFQTAEKQEQDGRAHPVVQSQNPLLCLLSKGDTEQISLTEGIANTEPFEN